ncbi:DUF262 domain-containing protein [Streptococcus infantis]|uniref:GmrSD restriction endonuclease domain-containing protein n=1 Tax=Streptococcus infantis TaxID=68892 RepID=UPI0039C1DC79
MGSEKYVQPDELNVVNVFENGDYVIPIYQRNYAWRKKEIEQLLTDIDDLDESNSGKYYLGSLVVNQVQPRVYEVIDGQQRLTTLFLLLRYLDHPSVERNPLKFEAREKSNITISDIKTVMDSKNPSLYSEELVEGYEIIKKYFQSKNTGDNYIKRFRDKITTVTIVRTQVPQNIDLNHYFEIMNTRGEQLELHEIVKAKILGAIKSENRFSEEDKKDKLIASTIWDACAQMDNYLQMAFPLKIREKIFSENWDMMKMTDFSDLRDIFNEEENSDETKFTLKSILQAPDPTVSNQSYEREEENERFESIINFPNFLLQVNEAMEMTETDHDSGLDDKRFLDLLKDRWTTKEKALEFIYALLKYRYLFDRYIIKREYIGEYKVEGKWSLQKLVMYEDKKGRKPSYKSTLDLTDQEEGKDNQQLRLLESCLRVTYTSPKTMHWIARVLTSVNKEPDGNLLITSLEKYCCQKIESSDYRNRRGFSIDRIVFTYLDYLLAKDRVSEFSTFQFQFRNSIEHFFPQHPINGDNSVTVENRDMFGNLALITVSANSKFSNRFPIEKVEHFPSVIEQSPKLKVMSDLVKKYDRKWDNDCVKEHHESMLSLLEKEIEKYK